MAFSPPLSCTFFFIFIIYIWGCSFISNAETPLNREAYNSSISSLLSEELYNTIFLHKDDVGCPAKGFYTYDSFINATGFFPNFSSAGSLDTNKRELAAFLAQISHETTGKWESAPDGPYAWGLCFKEELNLNSSYCDLNSTEWLCSANKSYHGRGPMQLSWNYNYGEAGAALGFDGLREPELVANRSDIAFKTALWFWMTARNNKPSCHDVMVGSFVPTSADTAANRVAGFGLVTNIINGGLECLLPNDTRVEDRIGFYQRYAQLLDVEVGPNLDCANQKPY
ncbi:Chitinase 10 [Platanthera zijinensis]|uniref:chitinase n=1 Tax=Platanthera zijinensis TaxID=2320716 RepID=A0AAP0AT18_9ASPA